MNETKKELIPYKWTLVGILWFAYFLNQGDRQIFNTVIPLIKEDLGLTDVAIGNVVMIFTAIYGILVPVSGFLGDFLSRKWIVISSLLIFSLGTLLTGISGGFVLLVIFRSVATGAGEAFYYPAATSLLSQLHVNTISTALSIHKTSLYVGIVASGAIS
ncbi:MAG: MFS transporter, partial [Opitutales bacterium]|nr:MFS transporter [Opitutales bacterium]